MKVEHKEIPINKFVGLKSKMYSMLSHDGKESNTANGVNIATEFNKCRDTLSYKKVPKHQMKRIQSKKYKLGTYEIKAMSLLCFYDKRFVLNNSIYTLAYFQNNLREQILTDDHKKKRFKKILTDDHK